MASGIDPVEKKKRDAQAAKVAAANSFASVARAYIVKCQREGRADATVIKQEWLLKLLDRAIGSRPVFQIEPFELLEAVRHYESTRRTQCAHRALQFASQVFRFAIASQMAKSDPTRDLRGALVSHKVEHHAALQQPVQVGALLRPMHGLKVARLCVRPSNPRRCCSSDPANCGMRNDPRSTWKAKSGAFRQRR